MLANLWDVTDKDIDRLSYGVFSRWGLCEERPKSRGSEDNFETEKGMSIAFNGISVEERKRKLQSAIKGTKYVTKNNGISMAEALAKARDDCRLKYLNGGAPVVYGVPVFLEA
jgi:separase